MNRLAMYRRLRQEGFEPGQAAAYLFTVERFLTKHQAFLDALEAERLFIAEVMATLDRIPVTMKEGT